MSDNDLPPLPTRKPTLPIPQLRTLRTVIALMLREMGTTYGRSPGGYAWAIISPVGSILVMALAFSLLVHSPALGTSFILFYATGFLPYDMFSSLAQKIGLAIRYSRPLMAYPGVTWADAIIARFILTVLTMGMVSMIVLWGIILLAAPRTEIDIRPLLVGYGAAALLGLGVGMVNCLLNGYFPTWERVWAIASRPIFLASGVFFLYEGLPRVVRDLLWWNPLFHAIAWARTGVYPTYDAAFVSHTYMFGVPLILIAGAAFFLRDGHRASLQR